MKKLNDTLATLAGVAKTAVFLALIVFFIPVALIAKLIDPKNPYEISQLFHTLLLRILGIRLRVFGVPSTAAPVLFVANHVSYLDIPVLGSLLPASFVAKSEVAGWPLFGYLAKIQNTLFIERRSTRAAAQRTQLQTHLAKRHSLILFPEGTSSDGLAVLPFKSSLFSIVEDTTLEHVVTIQPISLTCTELGGFPLLREERALFAWYGDMTLQPHLWNVFKRGDFTIEVVFHEPVLATEYADRKILAAACQTMVGHGIEQSLKGQTALAGQKIK